MITNDLLREKYEAHKRLDEAAEHDLERYIENTHKVVLEAEKNHGLKFKYGQIEGKQLGSPRKSA